MRDLIHTRCCFQNIPLNFGKDLKNRFFSLGRKKEIHYSLWRKYRRRTDWWVSYNQSRIARQLSKSHDEHVPTHSHEFWTQIDINESLLDFFFNASPAEKRKKDGWWTRNSTEKWSRSITVMDQILGGTNLLLQFVGFIHPLEAPFGVLCCCYYFYLLHIWCRCHNLS